MPNKAQKVWPIRMPEDLLEELKERAQLYDLPIQTFTKYVIRQGLEHEKEIGLEVDPSEEAAFLAHKRKMIVRRQKAELEAQRKKLEGETPSEIAPPTETLAELSGPVDVLSPAEVEAMIGADSTVKAEAQVQTTSEPEDILADMGVPDAPPPIKDTSMEEEINSLLSTI